MANEKRVRGFAIGGLVEDNPLAAAATTLTSAGLAALPAIGGSEHAAIVFDPDGLSGAPFVKYVTAHAAGGVTATITAAAQETGLPGMGGARAVDRDTPWVHAPTLADYPDHWLIAVKTYTPGATSTYNTTSGTYVDVDATNLVVAFTAPPSGHVLVRLSALVLVQLSSDYLDWNLRDGSGDVAGTDHRVLGGTAATQMPGCVVIDKSGLTPGTTYTWKWGYRKAAGSGSVTTYAGGTTGTAAMEVLAVNSA